MKFHECVSPGGTTILSIVDPILANVDPILTNTGSILWNMAVLAVGFQSEPSPSAQADYGMLRGDNS